MTQGATAGTGEALGGASPPTSPPEIGRINDVIQVGATHGHISNGIPTKVAVRYPKVTVRYELP